MPVPKERRDAFFITEATAVIEKYSIKTRSRGKYLDAQRFGHLMCRILIKIYNSDISLDAEICFRDWAIENRITCSMILSAEMDGESKIKQPYQFRVNRVHEQLSFGKYFTLLEGLLEPDRQPLTRRTPVRWLPKLKNH